MLNSKLFSGNARLQRCSYNDPDHVKTGDKGDFVGLIQIALIRLGYSPIDDGEMEAQLYGKSTADRVFAYKRDRNIVNRSYQTAPDNITGKMTIKSLDDEMLVKEREGQARAVSDDRYNEVRTRSRSWS